MEKVDALALLNKSGGERGGSVMTRVTIPAKWAREMHISENHRDLELTFDGETITITNNKERIIMLEKLGIKLADIAIKEIDEIGFLDDSDMVDRFLDDEAYKLLKKEIKDEDEAYDTIDDLVQETKDNFTDDVKEAAYKDNFCFYKNEKGLRKWIENILMIETGDTYSQEDVDELTNELYVD